MVYVFRFVCGYYTLLLPHLPRTKNTEGQFKNALELVEFIEKPFYKTFLYPLLRIRMYLKSLYHQFSLSYYLLIYNFDS